MEFVCRGLSTTSCSLGGLESLSSISLYGGHLCGCYTHPQYKLIFLAELLSSPGTKAELFSKPEFLQPSFSALELV